MAWDPNTQHTGTMDGCTWEWGLATTASNTIEVSTRLKVVHCALMMHSAAAGTDDSIWCDRTITNGCVTMESDDDAEFQYLLIGW